MPDRKPTLYERLGVSRSATTSEIARAYQKIRAEFQKASTPPDSKQEFLVRDAYEVLSDDYRRRVYDESLEGARRKKVSLRRSLAGGAAAVVAGLAAYSVYRPGPTAEPPRAPEDIRNAASLAVGRVELIDVSGRSASLGLAFAIQSGVMVTSCEGISPGAQLLVRTRERAIPARVIFADEARGLCRLEAHAAGSWPLPLREGPLRNGESIYAPAIDANGQLRLVEGTVKRIPAPQLVEASMATSGGTPLIDRHGRVMAVAVGGGRHIPVPPDWVREAPLPIREVERVERVEPPAPETVEVAGVKRRKVEIPEHRRKALEKAMEGSIVSVPDDL